MSAPAPLLSVIVVCKNPGPRLRTALESVWSAASPSIELVVIDGASTDGTREWLQSESRRIHHLASERDLGLYHAMNKGVAAAQGTWVLFLGADDRLAAPDAIDGVMGWLTMTSADVACAEARFDDGRHYRPALAHGIRRNFLHHQGTFYRRTLFSRFGSFDLNLGLMADYDFNLRLQRGGATFETRPLLIAECASGGASDSGRWHGYREEITVRHRHFPFMACLPWNAGSVIRYLRKKAVRAQARNRPE